MLMKVNVLWDKRTCEIAAAYGNLDCLIYAHENGCPWDEKTCEIAASRGSLNCLKYAFKNKFSQNKKTCQSAATNEQLDCFKYAFKNGCPIGDIDFYTKLQNKIFYNYLKNE